MRYQPTTPCHHGHGGRWRLFCRKNETPINEDNYNKISRSEGKYSLVWFRGGSWHFADTALRNGLLLCGIRFAEPVQRNDIKALRNWYCALRNSEILCGAGPWVAAKCFILCGIGTVRREMLYSPRNRYCSPRNALFSAESVLFAAKWFILRGIRTFRLVG
ncbi:hypothetical protein LXL04_011968 [Taraxacum kok-saghyz]